MSAGALCALAFLSGGVEANGLDHGFTGLSSPRGTALEQMRLRATPESHPFTLCEYRGFFVTVRYA